MAGTAPSVKTPEPPKKPRARGLPPEAYEAIPGDQYAPYVPDSQSPAELTVKAVLIGIVLGIVFGAANAYLGLRVGLTVSASIPAAVMAIAIFRVLRTGTILETNVVQTIGSAGESLAAGVIFTLPALYIWGIDADWYVLATVAFLGGLLGILFMIPLRRFLMVREHGNLPFPEGTATAEVQVAGEAGGSKATMVFGGLGIGALFQMLVHGSGVALWPREPEAHLFGEAARPGLRRVVVSGDLTPELLGVGFIIGPKIAAVMLAGGLTAWLALIPLVDLFGSGSTAPVFPETATLIGDMDAGDHLDQLRALHRRGRRGGRRDHHADQGPPAHLSRASPWGCGRWAERRAGSAAPTTTCPSPRARGALAIAVILWILPFIEVSFLGALLMVLFSFFFVTVSARIVGLIGSSSNPVSGMTIAALLVTALIYLSLGYTQGTPPSPCSWWGRWCASRRRSPATPRRTSSAAS